MESGSWSSYVAAGEPGQYSGGYPDDDEPPPGFEAWEILDCPGVYEIWFRSGWGRANGRSRRLKTGLSFNQAVAIAADLNARYQERLHRWMKAEADAEDARAADEAASIAANHAAMDAVDAALVASMRHKCDWCGAEVSIVVQVCEPCLATYLPEDVTAFESDSIPW